MIYYFYKNRSPEVKLCCFNCGSEFFVLPISNTSQPLPLVINPARNMGCYWTKKYPPTISQTPAGVVFALQTAE